MLQVSNIVGLVLRKGAFFFLSPFEMEAVMLTNEILPAPSEHFKGKRYQQLVDDLRLASLAKRTVYGYVGAVRKLANEEPEHRHSR